MFFGGIEGVTAFYPDQIRDNPFVPPVVLTSLTQNGETLDVDLNQVSEITARWPENSFEFEFAALNYTRSENNQYAYMLEGFDREWNQIGSKHSGRYTNLPGGRYTLRLKGSNNDGVWNETGASIVVEVIPPFWATWWFRGAGIVLLAGLVFGAVRVRVRSVEGRNQELERMVRARTSEIERLYQQTKELAVVEERNRLARDLHDSAKQKAFAALAQLGAANGLVRADPVRAQSALGEAETLVYEVIEDLTFLIQDMYPAALKEKGLPAVLREYLYEWESRTGIVLTFRMENERRLPLQVEQALYRVIQEGLANVAGHSKARAVEVRLFYTNDSVSALIADNGAGFDLSKRPTDGVGMRSMYERIAIIGGEMSIQSIPGKGTHVSFVVPLIKAE
jgi:signal transduction histidine kinase